MTEKPTIRRRKDRDYSIPAGLVCATLLTLSLTLLAGLVIAL